MRWYRALTYKREQTGTDETRNPVFRLVETGEHILVRTPPWMPVLDETEGNRFSMVERTFLTKSRPELLEGVAAIKVRGVLYSVESVTHEAPTVAVNVRRCTKDGWDDHIAGR